MADQYVAVSDQDAAMFEAVLRARCPRGVTFDAVHAAAEEFGYVALNLRWNGEAVVFQLARLAPALDEREPLLWDGDGA